MCKHVTGMEEINVFNILFGNPEEKMLHGKSWYKRKDYIKIR